MNNFAQRWLFSTNHKNISTLYCIFGTIDGVMGTCFSMINVICLSMMCVVCISSKVHHKRFDFKVNY